MGYRIDYGETEAKKLPLREKKRTVSAMTAGFFALFLLLTLLFWKDGRAFLQDAVLPGDSAVTAAALQGLVTDLGAGESFGDAVAVFCREVIAGAG